MPKPIEEEINEIKALLQRLADRLESWDELFPDDWPMDDSPLTLGEARAARRILKKVFES